jgi:RecA/RadA recombinase
VPDENTEKLEDLFNSLSKSLSKDDHAEVVGDDIRLKSFVPYGIPSLPCIDIALGRPGMPVGKVIELYGWEMCLSGDTRITYAIRTKRGKQQNTKGGTLERLYHRFHKIKIPGRGNYQRKQTVGSDFYAPSVNEEGRIFQNKIQDVVYTGSNECVRLTTRSGLSIDTTEDHRFYDGTTFVRAKDLEVGDVVFTHNRTPHTDIKHKRIYRPEIFVKHHPVASTKIVKNRDKKYEYKRLKLYRAIYEADMNNLALDEYVRRLNVNELDGLTFLPTRALIHHKDGDSLNNNISNLEVTTNSDHMRHHYPKNHNNLRYTIVPDEVIGIKPVGIKDTYDLKMEGPHHNYVANGFVVHNCGKSTLALHLVAACQAMGGAALWIDAENCFDPDRAQQLGVNTNKPHLIKAECETIESVINTQEKTLDQLQEINYTKPFIIVTDSTTSVSTEKALKEELKAEQRVGHEAKQIRSGMKRLSYRLGECKVPSIFINHNISRISSTPGAGATSAGGHAIKFWAAVRIELARIKELEHEVRGEKVRHGQRVKFIVRKNKVSELVRTKFECDLRNDVGFDIEDNLLDACRWAGMITHTGSVKNLSASTTYTLTFGDRVEKIKRDEWPSLVKELGGVDTVWKAMLESAQSEGIIKPYGIEL